MMTSRWGLVLVLCVSAAAVAGEANLLPNGDFADRTPRNAPAGWRVGGGLKVAVTDEDAPEGAGQCLRMEVAEAGSSYGEVVRKVRVDPNRSYVLTGMLKGTADGLGFFQIKLYRDGRELRRVKTDRSTKQWQPVARTFFTGPADTVGVLCRCSRKEKVVGEVARFAAVRLAPAPPPALEGISAVATFECIGLTVPFTGAPGPEDRCAVRYRRRGEKAWHVGLPLVAYRPESEYRGSLVALEPNAIYDVACELGGPGAPKEARAVAASVRTWAEDVPVGRVVRLPAGVTRGPLVIGDRGTPEAWVLYTSAEGGSTIDAGTAADHAVTFDGASCVVFHGVTVRGGRKDCIAVNGSDHVRIRRCDIAGWGAAVTRKEGLEKGLYVNAEGKTVNFQAGVRVQRGSRQVVVEENFIHAPRGTANAWRYGHPMGPQGVILASTGGNNVVRHNDMIGSESHWWNDAIESIANRAVTGGPYRDTDIYGNVLAFCNDDGTELDGGQINVRYWHNWIDKALCGVSCAPNRRGPSYVFRNLIVLTGEEFFKTGAGFKMGGDRYSDPGLSLLLHNTVWTTGNGLTSGHYGKGPTPMVTRNNVFAGPLADNGRIRYRHRRGGDFDYDLLPANGLYGLRPVPAAWEAHGATGSPTFRDRRKGDFRLAAGSKGIDAGARLPGFNDGFAGEAPDMGAFERGRDEEQALFPPRPAAMAALPLRSHLVAGAGEVKTTVRLRAPASAGKTWRAIPNADWLRCTPAEGRCGDGWQSVTVAPAAKPADIRLYRGAVTFRTDAGLCRTVMVNVKVYPDPHVRIDREAESGTIAGGFRKVDAADASGGAYVEAAIADSNDPDELRWAPEGELRFDFETPAAGRFRLMARVAVPGPADRAGLQDSFFFSIDGGEKRQLPVYGFRLGQWKWIWARTGKADGRVPHELPLKAGKHTVTIHTREPLTRIDRLVLTNAPYFEPPAADRPGGEQKP